MFMSHVEYKGIQFKRGMKLVDEDRREFVVGCVTERIVVICGKTGNFSESVSHGFASLKYKELL